MKHQIYYISETRLVGGGGIKYGELGGFTTTQSFQDFSDAIHQVNKDKSLVGSENIYNPLEIPTNKKEAEEGRFYHLISPKIWRMCFRGDWNTIEQWKERDRTINYTHIKGDSYVVKYEYFNLKTRKMEYSNHEETSLENAVKLLKIKDSKTRLASDFTFYSKRLATLTNHE